MRERVWLLGLILFWATGHARAHREETPQRDRLELDPQGVRLTIEYSIPAGEEARALRRLADADHSGDLSPAERDGLAERLARQAAWFANIWVDGKRFALARGEPVAAFDGADDGRVAVTVTLSAAVVLGDRPHTVRIADRHPDRRVRVPLSIVTHGLKVDARLPPLPMLGPGQPVDLPLVPVR